MTRPEKPTRDAADLTPGPEEALLVDRYRQLLRKAIARMTPHAQAYDVDDIEQEASKRLLGALRKGMAVRNMESYVYRIGITTAIDALRKIQRRREDAIEEVSRAALMQWSDLGTPEDQLIREQRLASVRKVFDRLSAPRRAAVLLHLKGHTIEEVAMRMDWTEPKARNLIYRGMNELKTRCQALERT